MTGYFYTTSFTVNKEIRAIDVFSLIKKRAFQIRNDPFGGYSH